MKTAESSTPPHLRDIAALGYADFAEGSTEHLGGGVVHHEPALTDPGFNLYTSLPNSKAVLIDMDGTVVRSWETEDLAEKTGWSRAELLSNGDLLCIRTHPVFNQLFRFSWNGDVLWRRDLFVHHDFDELPDGGILVLTQRQRMIPAMHEAVPCWDNYVAFLTAEGEVQQRMSIYRVLASAPEVFELAPPEDIDPELDKLIDLLHCNAVDWIDHSGLERIHPALAGGNVLLTSRHQNLVAIANVADQRLLWAWGPGELQAPHEASVLTNGRILILDNGWERRGYSRIVQVDPVSNEIVWEYTAPEPTDFFTNGRGSVQALGNGNFLVGNSNSGEAFEITPAGRIVWRFLNPNVNEEGQRAVLQIARYDEEFVSRQLRDAANGNGRRRAGGD